MTQTVVLRPIIVGLTIASLLGGCKSPTASSSAQGPQSSTPVQASPQQASSPGQPSPQPQMTPMTIYTAAADCVTFVPKKVELSSENVMHEAVAKVLASQPAIASEIASYTVKREGDTATIDFQMRPQAQKTMTSLSLCEQFALFGSLRETLVQPPQWGIKTVRFTEAGKDLAFEHPFGN